MKHLKLFQNDLSFDNYKISHDYKVPNVVKTLNNNHIDYKNKIKYNFVDLGLPSGTLWADRNIGAWSIYDGGLYFAWGETKGYYFPNEEKSFTWNDYKFSINGSDNNFSKYSKTKNDLEPIDDAARIYIGIDCKMPDNGHQRELYDGTTREYISNYNNSGVNGILLTSKNNSNTLFFPFVCCIDNGEINNKTINPSAIIWGSESDETYANTIYMDNWEDSCRMFAGNTRFKYMGCSIRAIKAGS